MKFDYEIGSRIQSLLPFNPFRCVINTWNDRLSISHGVLFIFKLKLTDIAVAGSAASAEHNVAVPLGKLHQEECPALMRTTADAFADACAQLNIESATDQQQLRSKFVAYLWRHCRLPRMAIVVVT